MSIPTFEKFIDSPLRYRAQHPHGAWARDVPEATTYSFQSVEFAKAVEAVFPIEGRRLAELIIDGDPAYRAASSRSQSLTMISSNDEL